LDGIKLEFFRATTPLQKEILSNTSTIYYNDGKLQIIDVKSIAKLKLIALLLRNKSRDLFDFKIILDKKLLTTSELVYICTQTKKINSLALLYSFIEKKSEPKDDESVYLDENRPINLSFDEIKKETLCALKIY
jgi:hypothetical protein